MNVLKAISAGIGILIAFFLVVFFIGFLAQGTDFFMFKFWAPKYENVKRKVFEQTYSYNQGMVQDLENQEFHYYETTNEEARAALAQIILHEASAFDPKVLQQKNPDLYQFIEKLRNQQISPSPQF
jgi:hypothetical protein